MAWVEIWISKCIPVRSDKYVNLTAGGSEDILASGDTLEETESAVDIESLISKYALGGV